MKKVMFVVLVLVFAVSAFAQTSNKVGFVKIHVAQPTPGGQSSWAFGLPFKFWTVTANVPQYNQESFKPSSIVGSQITPGPFPGTNADKIVRQAGDNAYINSTPNPDAWAGLLETSGSGGMIPGKAFWVVNKNSGLAGGYDVVLAGEVSNGGYATVTDVPNFTNPPSTQASVAISWRDARNVPVPNLGLVDGVNKFLGGGVFPNYTGSDRLVPQTGGGFAARTGAGAWAYGTPFPGYISPGVAYWIVSKHPNHPWSYTYSAPAALAVVGDDGGVATPTSAFTKAPVAPTKAAAVESVKTTTVKKPVSVSSKSTVKK